jgi:phospholipase/carboxylesterase
MQRTEPSAFQQCVPSTEETKFTLSGGQFSAGVQSAPYALFAPLHYEPGYAYPLIVWLHGDGNDERQLMRVMPEISMRNYVAVAPRGLGPFATAGLPGYRWRPTEEHDDAAAQRVDECIELARERFNIARQRIFLAGFDGGGSMAFRLAFDQPQRFAGVLSLCGSFPARRAAFGNLLAIRRLPVFLTAGRYSTEYASPEVCENLRMLHSAGVSITLRQYPGGQELSRQMLGDMDRWIIDQITAAKAA